MAEFLGLRSIVRRVRASWRRSTGLARRLDAMDIDVVSTNSMVRWQTAHRPDTELTRHGG